MLAFKIFRRQILSISPDNFNIIPVTRTHEKKIVCVFLTHSFQTQNFSSHFSLFQHVIHFYTILGTAASHYPALPF